MSTTFSKTEVMWGPGNAKLIRLMSNNLHSDASLHGQASKLRAILDSAVDAIITIDRNGIITTVNPAAERLFGYRRDEFIGRNVHFLMPDPYHSEHDGYIHAYRTTVRKKIIGIGREVQGLRADGTIFPLHLAVSEFEIENGGAKLVHGSGWIVLLRAV